MTSSRPDEGAAAGAGVSLQAPPATAASPVVASDTQPGASRPILARCRDVLVHPAAFAVAPVLAVFLVQLVSGGTFVGNFDYAALELGTQDAARGQRLLGPYSRFGWNHPGPLLFYLAVPWYWVLASNGGLALCLARLSVDVACLVTIVVLVDRMAGRVVAWGAAAGLLWFELQVGLAWFRDPWNPYSIVLPVVCTFVVGAALLQGHGTRARLLVLAALSSLAVQSHVSTAPLVAVGVVAGLWGWVSTWRTRRRAAAVDAALLAGLLLVLWCLPLWEQLTEWRHGNVARIVKFFVTSGKHPSLGQVLRPTTLAIALPNGDVGSQLGSYPLSVPAQIPAARWLLVALLVGVAGAWCLVSWRRGSRAVAVLAGMVPAGVVVAIASGTRVRGEPLPYLFAPALAVGALGWLVLGGALAWAVARWTRREQVVRVVAAVAAVGLVAAVAVRGSDAFDPVRERFASPAATEIAPTVSRLCRAGQPIRLTTRGQQVSWFDYLSVAAAFGECAPDVTLDDWVTFIVGSDRTDAAPAHSLRVLLQPPTAAAEPGWERVFTGSTIAADVPAGPPG